MVAGTNIEHATALNRRVVLEAVRRHAPVSRAEIARATGLSPQTISNIVAELDAAGLVRAGGRRAGRRGQPATEITLDPRGGFAAGLHLGHRRIAGVLVDLAGAVLATEERRIAAPPPEALRSTMAEMVSAMLREARLARADLWGVGCVMPGQIEAGELMQGGPTMLPDAPGFSVGRWLEAALAIPVTVANDAAAAAIAEQLYGIGREATSFFYIHFGLGVGGGMILAGQHYRGARGRAGELGHLIVKPGGRACPCGNRGCLEQYVSLQAAAETITGPERDAAAIDPAELQERFAAGDPRLLGWTSEAAPYLRLAIHSIETFFDPDTIVLGGALPPSLLDALIRNLDPLLPSISAREHRPHPRVHRSRIGADIPALGAAALPISFGTQPDPALLWKQNGLKKAKGSAPGPR